MLVASRSSTEPSPSKLPPLGRPPPFTCLGFGVWEMCSGSEAGSYLRLIDSCITQLKAQGPSRTCNESKEEGEEFGVWGDGFGFGGWGLGAGVDSLGVGVLSAPPALQLPLSSELGTCKTVKARFRPWLEPLFR